MSIVSLVRDYGVKPCIVRMLTTDNFSTITANGYLNTQTASFNSINGGAFQWVSTDIVLIDYSGGQGFFQISSDFSTLIDFIQPGSVDSISGTTNEVIVSSPTGNVVLSLPQQIATSSSPTFTGVTVGNLQLGANTFSSTNSNGSMFIVPNGSGKLVLGANSLNGLGGTVETSAVGIASYGAATYNTTANDGSGLDCARSRSTTIGSFAAVELGDSIGAIRFLGDDGTEWVRTSFIGSLVTGSVSTGIIPSDLVFYTTNGSGVESLGMTLDQNQILTLANPLPVGSGGTGSTGGAVLLSPSGAQTITGFGLTLPTLTATGITVSTSGPEPTLNLVGTAAQSIPLILMYENTSTLIGSIQGGINLSLSNYGSNLILQTKVSGGTVALFDSLGNYFSFGAGTMSANAAINLAPAGGSNLTYTSANAVHSFNFIGTNATPLQLLNFYTNTSTLAGQVVSGINSSFNAYGTGVALVNNLSGGAIYLRDSTGNALTISAGNTILSGSLTTSQTGGIIGTTTNNSAAAGSVGEFVSSVIAVGAPTSLTSTTNADVTSISLTAGDWDVLGNISYVPGSGTTAVSLIGWISTTSATLPAAQLYNATLIGGAVLSIDVGLTPPSTRISLSGTTTVYMSTVAVFAVNTLGACGGLYARRVR